VTGVAIWPAQRAAQFIRTGLFAKRPVHAQREGTKAAVTGRGKGSDVVALEGSTR